MSNSEYYRKYYEANKERLRAAKRAWSAKNKDKIKASVQKYCQSEKGKNTRQVYTVENRDVCNEGKKQYRRRLRVEALNGYGAICKCCNEVQLEFLTIDHVGNNGATERAKGIKSQALYAKVIKEDFPPYYQVLCFNCNCAKGIYGVCPHEKEKTEEGLGISHGSSEESASSTTF